MKKPHNRPKLNVPDHLLWSPRERHYVNYGKRKYGGATIWDVVQGCETVFHTRYSATHSAPVRGICPSCGEDFSGPATLEEKRYYTYSMIKYDQVAYEAMAKVVAKDRLRSLGQLQTQICPLCSSINDEKELYRWKCDKCGAVVFDLPGPRVSIQHNNSVATRFLRNMIIQVVPLFFFEHNNSKKYSNGISVHDIHEVVLNSREVGTQVFRESWVFNTLKEAMESNLNWDGLGKPPGNSRALKIE